MTDAVMGRPRLFSDAKAFEDAAEDYFDQLAPDRMPTLAGLCLHMGFHDKESFGHYATYGDDFSRTVKRARLRIEEDRNQRLANPACTGVIFDLKHNHGWRDKSEVELSGPDGEPIKTVTRIELVGVEPDDNG